MHIELVTPLVRKHLPLFFSISELYIIAALVLLPYPLPLGGAYYGLMILTGLVQSGLRFHLVFWAGVAFLLIYTSTAWISGHTPPMSLILTLIGLQLLFSVPRGMPVYDIKVSTIWLFVLIMYVHLFLSILVFPRPDGRFTLNHVDPNFSGVGAFLFLIFLVKRHKTYPALAVLILMVFLLSRAALLSTLVFLFFNNTSVGRSLHEKVSPFLYLLVGNVLIMLFSYYSARLFFADVAAADGVHRLLQVRDISNAGRFAAFAKVPIVFSRAEVFFFGLTPDEVQAAFINVIPHNTVFLLAVQYGWIVTTVYTGMVFWFFKRYEGREFRPALIALATYSFFLHSILQGYFIIGCAVVARLTRTHRNHLEMADKSDLRS